MKQLQVRNSFLLLLAAVIWGIAFVAQSVGMEYVGAFTFTCVRSWIGGFVLIPCIYFLQKINKEEKKEYLKSQKELETERKNLLLGGILCGIFLTIATCLQQIGMQYTSVGKAGFITAFYIIIVPILGIFLRKKCSAFVWIGVLFALAGLYCLCITDNSFSQGVWIEKGDLYIFLCAFVFSCHILCIDYFSEQVDGVKMSCIQFFLCGMLTTIPMFLLEQPSFENILLAWKPILYAGILSNGGAYTLQIIGQKGMNPTVASLILSLESVISVLAGLLILGQKLSERELIGCVLMFIAIILAQLPKKEKN